MQWGDDDVEMDTDIIMEDMHGPHHTQPIHESTMEDLHGLKHSQPIQEPTMEDLHGLKHS
jgi:hypothetical protein